MIKFKMPDISLLLIIIMRVLKRVEHVNLSWVIRCVLSTINQTLSKNVRNPEFAGIKPVRIYN